MSYLAGRTLARCQAVQILFQAEARDRSVDEVLASDLVVTGESLDPYAEQLACGVSSMQEKLDTIIDAASKNWDVRHMAPVDRNLLRLAVYEIVAVDEVAAVVAVAEAVRLAKILGTDDSFRFINGVLGRIVSDSAEASAPAVDSAKEACVAEPLEDTRDADHAVLPIK